jgi:hypothetical protein
LLECRPRYPSVTQHSVFQSNENRRHLISQLRV